MRAPREPWSKDELCGLSNARSSWRDCTRGHIWRCAGACDGGVPVAECEVKQFGSTKALVVTDLFERVTSGLRGAAEQIARMPVM